MEALQPIYDALQSGDWEGARAQCRDLLVQVPDFAPAHHALGMSLCGEGAYPGAVKHLERAVAASGGRPSFVHDLAAVYARLEQWGDAARLLHSNLSILDEEDLVLFMAACVESGECEDALNGLLRRYATEQPQSAPLLAELGRALYAQGELENAEAVLLRALALDPATARARDGLAMRCQAAGRSDEALEHWAACVGAQPDSGRAHLRLAMALAEKGRVTDSAAERAEAMRLGLTRADRSMALYLMLFDDRQTAETLLAAYRGAFPAQPGASCVPARPRHSGLAPRSEAARLRVGYLSGEFSLTPAYYFISPFLESHDRSRVKVFLYNTNGRHRARPPAYLQSRDCWRDLARSPDEDVRAVVKEDGLDVLVDLSGHFPDNRLPVFASRAVDVQASFPNFPSTTGCPEMNYLFTDVWTSPPGSDGEYSEQLYRLPSGYLVYAPPLEVPTVAPCPVLRRGLITFGVVQRASKLTPSVWDCLADVLGRVPGSRLLLHNGDVELDDPLSGMSRFLREQLASRQVDPGRLLLRGRRTLREHLELFGEIDIALDTSPYGGQTTTAESLWMGVPVVTLTGPTNVSRVSAGLILRAGLPQFVAHTPASYVKIASSAAADRDALVALRASLRDQVRDAGLTDGVQLAREMEAAYCAWAGR